MAATAAFPAMHDAHKALHPFFSKSAAPSKPQPDEQAPALENQSSLAPPDHDEAAAIPTTQLPVPSEPDNDSDHIGQPTPPKRGRPKGRGKAKASPSTRKKGAVKQGEPVSETVEEQSDTRRKRRRLSQDAAANLGAQVQVPASSPPNEDVKMGGQGSEDMIIPQSSPPQLPSSQPDAVLQTPSIQPSSSSNLQAMQTTEITEQPASTPPQDAGKKPKSPPKKMLQLKAGGRLASPVKPVQSAASATEEEVQPKKPAKRGRKKKEKHMVVICCYPPHGGIGYKIDRILASEERYLLAPPAAKAKPPPVTMRPPPSHAKAAPFDPSKPTHPFFSGKPKPAPPSTKPPTTSTNLAESPRRTSAVTPGKLRAQRQSQKIQEADYEPMAVPFGNSRDRMISKQPGMKHAPFPPKGLAHVRGDFTYQTNYHPRSPPDIQSAPANAGMSRKMKRRVAVMEPAQSLLSQYRDTLEFNQDDPVRPDGFRNPPSSLRVPNRMLISGSKIQELVYDQLDHSSTMHPACVAMYDSIPSTTTPYDHGCSEVYAWAQKYAPTCSDNVLQPGKEAIIARDWMKALTVVAVNGFASQTAKVDRSEQKLKKKRRKRAPDLDDFIVNSDEDVNDMDELAEPDDHLSSQGSTLQKRSLVQQGGVAKLSNAILISGPSGSGKSAMAYAVAKELGFEVFEINSGSRRSGKDVLDRVGDMVENHLVQRHVADTGNTSADEDAGRLSEAFKADLASGRQGTMGSFFASKPKKAQAVKKEHPKPEPKQQKVQQSVAKTKPSRNQKQSLILLEEVDILFDEDKGFWQTVFTLIINSKRPVIMTCNDEDLVPIQAMTLHAILRLSPTPTQIATDYMLLVAAKEGHMLGRNAVASLYESKGQDLRASITDLQLWCQMGVGDVRGGLGWIFQRWPKGTGVEENGLPIRVISDGTYQAGMGAVQNTPEPSLSMSNDRTEELLSQLWEDWGVDPRTRLFDQAERSLQPSQLFANRNDRLTALRDYEHFSDTMSAMDMYSSTGLPDNTSIDITSPPMVDKSRSNYIAGLALLQTPSKIDHGAFDTGLAVTTTYLASKVHNLPLDTSSSTLISDITSPEPHVPLTRAAFAPALEPLAYNPSAVSLGSSLSYTLLDGPFKPIVVDIAPYVRLIAAFDLALEAQRARMGGIDEGPAPKKMRTTRAARSALEGGQRSLTRRERWFSGLDLDLGLVLETGGSWPRFGGGDVEQVDSVVDTKME